MRTIRLHAALVLVFLATLLAWSPAAAQTAAPPQAAPPIERETQPEPDRDEAPRRFLRPIVRVAQDYRLNAGETVWEVQSVFGDVILEGRVEQDVVIVMGSINIAAGAVVDGSVVVIGGSATIDQNAVVRDDLVVIGGTLRAAPTFSPGGQHIVIGSPWMGDTLQGLTPWITSGLLWGRLIVPDIDWVWVFVGVFFLIYLVLNVVFDRAVAGSADVLVGRPLGAFMIGLLVLLLSGPALAIIAASVIGLAVVPFIICAMIVAGLVGKAGVARAIGRSVMRSSSPDGRVQATAAFIIGFVLLTLAYMVPVLGFLTWALTTVMGLGAATMTFRTLLRRERPVPPPPVPMAPVSPASAPVMSPSSSAGMSAATAGPSMTSNVGPAHVDVPPPVDVRPPAAIPLEPPPATAVYSQGLAAYPRASFLDRLAAFTLDCVLVAIANAILDMTRHDGFFFFLLLTYHIAFWAWRGTTLGGIICNLRVIRTHGAELRPPDAIVRGLSSVFSVAALGIGCFWMLQDPERQMWHDKIAGTLVVKVPKEMVLP